jgi:hypothetical protein
MSKVEIVQYKWSISDKFVKDGLSTCLLTLVLYVFNPV